MQLTETENIEYKRQLTDSTEKEVIGFLNVSGGELHIGVDDDGTVYGLNKYDEVMRAFTDQNKEQHIAFRSRFVFNFSEDGQQR